MAFYLFLRFQVDHESWPDFSDMLGWQKIKLLRGRLDPTKKLSYSAQNLAIKTAFLNHHINLKSWTHLGRKAGCQLGEALDVPDAQIRRLGHWDTSRMANHYSSGIARQAARIIAGHGNEAGNYYLSRESMNPPENLRRQIFPHIEKSLEYVCSRSDDEQDLAAQAFLKVLDWFRTVLLQDAVELRRFYPESPLWSHAPFNTPEFRTFELHLETTSKMNDLPMELRFKQLMPEVANQIQGMKEIMFNEFSGLTTNQQRLEEVVNHIGNQTLEIINRITPIESFTERFAKGEIKWITHLSNVEGSCVNDNHSMTRLINSLDIRDRSLLLSSDTTTIAPISSNSDINILSSNTMDDDVQQIPQYEVNNNLQSVREMWEEWDQGLIDNNSGIRSPAIRYLEEKYGTAWRITDRSRKRFSRRKLFIQHLQMISKNLNLPEALIAQKMEAWRQSKKWTLDKFQKTLQANLNQWGEEDMKLLDW